MEIEAKFRVSGSLSPAEIEGVTLAPYRLGPRRRVELEDTLLDSADRAIGEAAHALRLRRANGVPLVTLKGPKVLQGAVHQREEIELPLDGADPENPATWPAPMPERVAALVGGRPLLPRLHVLNVRHLWPVYHESQEVAELALDRGVILGGWQEMAMHEVEVELASGGEMSDLMRIATRLRDTLPLEPEPRGKSERGIAMIEAAAIPFHTLEEAAAAQPMSAAAPLSEAARAYLATQTLRLFEALPVAREGEDPEGVHDARVAIRRMRAALAGLEERALEPEVVLTLRADLKRIMRGFGGARDADVFLAFLDTLIADSGPATAEALAPLLALQRTRRANEYAALNRMLDEDETIVLLTALAAFVTTPGAGVLALDPGRIPPRRVRELAGGLIWSRYESILAYQRRLPEAPLPLLHRLRIAVKRLRYTLELLADALGPAATEPIQKLIDAQDHLGEIQDAAVAIELIGEIAGGMAAADEGLDRVLAAQRQRLATLGGNTDAVTAPLFAPPFRRTLAALIADL